jgi:Flp pilus assembly protein TadB
MAVTLAVLGALGLAGGVPLAAVGAGVVMAWQPVLGMVGLGVWAARNNKFGHSPGPDDEAAFLQGLAAELAAGSPPRAALVSAASRAPSLDLRHAVRFAAAGLDSVRVAAALREALPTHGRLTAAAWTLNATAGGPAATLFEVLAVRAGDDGALIRERRALTAQARASAWVVAGLPIVLLAGLFGTGRLSAASDPAMGLIVGVGIGLQAAGVAVVWTMLRRAT